MDYIARLIIPYLVNEIDTATNKQQKEQAEHHRQQTKKHLHTDKNPERKQTNARYYGFEERRKNQDRRQQAVARGRWIESRTKRDRRQENGFKTTI